ncbi:Protein-tyrosine sulfotransferase 2 [Willisornis vidua]|uniref:Protein-tyrosine sulfotransferase n=1 Tax=Willisornis vidua TaxID=1566151 RepID=A0ABQ9D752_9PASS|nr:Protein-tyrosine sulfotransferase 2 [Willisornis vidua]
MRRVLLVLGSVAALMVTLHLGQQVLECQQVLSERRHRLMRPENEELVMMDANHVEYRYSKDMPLIFIGGVPRSGTTLMRAMLDAHPEVRCGEETRIIPRVLAMRQAWSKSGREKMRLDEAGVTDQVLDAAMQAFILEVIAKHGEPARYLCNKDPFTLKSSVYLSRLFPNSKFLLMVRDGRASVHSMITRKVTIAGFDLNSYRDCLTKWNKAIEVMYSQCLEVGRARCLPVYYEQLVLHPEQSMHNIMKFLDISWSDTVLHHEELIGKPGGVSLSKIERSTDQVIKPVNMEALSKWIGHIPGDVLQDMAHIAPMLARLGYDPYANPPNYGHPDPLVVNNTHRNVANGLLLPKKEEFALARGNRFSKHIACSYCCQMTALQECICIYLQRPNVLRGRNGNVLGLSQRPVGIQAGDREHSVCAVAGGLVTSCATVS